MPRTPDASALERNRRRLLALLADDDVDAALREGLMEYPARPGLPADAPLLQAQARLRSAWQARERYRARAERLQRIADEREARRAPAPAPAADLPRAPALPAAAAAALERARARAARGRPE